MPSYAAEIISDISGKWVANGVRFPTEAEAQEYVKDLRTRSTIILNSRVVISTNEANYNWTNGRAVRIA